MSHCKMDGGGMQCNGRPDCGCECTGCRETRTATHVEGREAPRRYLPWANAGGPNECEHGYAAGIPCPGCDATIEACARAAYAVGRKTWAGDPRWEDLPQVMADHMREVARAVLAAAGRGGK